MSCRSERDEIMSLYDFVAKKGGQQEKDIEMITFKNYKHTSSKTLILHK